LPHLGRVGGIDVYLHVTEPALSGRKPWHTPCFDEVDTLGTVDAGEIMEAENTVNWTAKAQDTIEELRTRADGWDVQVRTFAREKPLVAVLCAMLGGYTLARLATWR
jgi:hypothetical protein